MNEDAARKLGGWISDGTYYLAAANDDARNANTLQDLSLQISSELIQMVDASVKDEAACNIHQPIQQICTLAIELNMMMLRSKAYFAVEWIEPMTDLNKPVLFNPSTMVSSESGGDRKYVLWGLTPILWKHGNADGQYYDEKTVLVKALVVCE